MQPTKVFIVDDEPDCSRLTQTILEKAQSFEVRVVNRPREAIAAAREFMPDIFILDVDMPGQDGGDLSREIRADSVLSGVPILFLTGLIGSHETSTGSALRGGMRFLSKPPAPFALIVAIRELLGQAGAVASPMRNVAGNY